MVFELIKNKKKDYYNICIGDETYLNSRVYIDSETNKPIQYYSNENELTEYLLNYKLSDFGDFGHLSLGQIIKSVKFKHSFSFTWNYEFYGEYGNKQKKKTNKLNFCIYFNPDLVEWKENYSFFEYYSEFEKLLKQSKFSQGKLRLYREDESAFDISFVIDSFDTPIKINIESYITELNKIHREIEFRLRSTGIDNSIITAFEFPEQIKSTCEQYLIYFATFLQDLGISVTSNLNEEAGKVLFSVTPTDDKEALDKIREALAVYLNLPASPIVYDDSFAAMRLQQQIENLQHSQRMAVRELQFNEKLLIAQSDTLHEKNTTISQQQSVIEQQNKIIEKISSKSIMMDSVENKEELEKIYDGVEAGHSKWLYELSGMKVNFIKLISTAVKNTLGKDDEKKSVLGLDEE